MTTYRWTAGAHIKADAQAVGEALDALQRDNGERLRPRVVVNAALPVDSVLHPCFEWNDTRAADLYREDQARHVMRSIRAVTTEGEQTTERRVFVNVIETIDAEAQHGYVTVGRALASDDLRQQIIVQARKDLIAFKARYSEFIELSALVDPLLAKLDAMQPQLAEVAA